ncbi:PilN [Desulforapulum autotrophicum HRM2]|uniref:PilN n=1 Tax=Desulforapulum autotrophicum (strain ATCC 43914 / DSM 3382 / VKM B-1955 / HRM2) TaxID=177437 RepID=C0QLC6_DESAH|nr:PilN domain-containing protein [Desulforapulum autotrophicum]ACN14212.1 PilN [Desulforapulum autotrophicum HRM2]
MIRINLLPFRAARRKENIRQQVSMFFLTLAFFILALIYFTIQMNQRMDRIEGDISDVNSQITLYKEKAGRVTQIMKNLAVLEQKFQIVKTLEARRWEPVTLLDAMTSLVVPEQMWITSIKTQDPTVTLKGIAYDNKTVADFMTRIEASPLFSGVDLKNIKMKVIDKTLQMKEFELLCNKTVQKNPETKNTVKK